MSMTADLFTLVRKKKWELAIERAGIFPEEASASFSFTFKNGITINTLPLHIACMKRAPLRAILSLIAADPSICDTIDGIGRAPLHNALRYGALYKVVSVLISCSRKSVYVKAFDGSLPIHLACLHSTSLLEGVLIIKFLLWIYPESVLITDGRGLSPKDCVLRNPSATLREELIKMLDSVHNGLIARTGAGAADGNNLDDNDGDDSDDDDDGGDDENEDDDDERRNDRTAQSSRSFHTARNGTSNGSNSRIHSENSSLSLSTNGTYVADALVTNTNNEETIATAHSDDKKKTKTKECVICYERAVSMVLIPCGHPCLCEKCASPNVMNKIKWRCPECRSSVDQIARFFGRIAVED